MRKSRREAMGAIINRSINETLSRTVLTTGTAILVVLSLFIFGGNVIRGFAFTLLVGFIVGTYSSIYIATPIVLWLQRGPRRQTRGGSMARGWSLRPAEAEGIPRLIRELGLSPLCAQLLAARGITSPGAAAAFLGARLANDLRSPMLFRQMPAAAERIIA